MQFVAACASHLLDFPEKASLWPGKIFRCNSISIINPALYDLQKPGLNLEDDFRIMNQSMHGMALEPWRATAWVSGDWDDGGDDGGGGGGRGWGVGLLKIYCSKAFPAIASYQLCEQVYLRKICCGQKHCHLLINLDKMAKVQR